MSILLFFVISDFTWRSPNTQQQKEWLLPCAAKKAVSAHFPRKQILPFGIVEQNVGL